MFYRIPTQAPIPKDPNYPLNSGQCGECGGHGLLNVEGSIIHDSAEYDVTLCETCEGKGWLLRDHPLVSRCHFDLCRQPIKPDSWSCYCSNDCAIKECAEDYRLRGIAIDEAT